jgi:hypothetical protein
MGEEPDVQLGDDRPNMMEMDADPVQQELMSLRREPFAQNRFDGHLWVNESALP